MATYKIKSGDTLSGIAKKYNTTVARLQSANSTLIKDPNNIKAGWVIQIPDEPKVDYTALGKQVEKCLDDIEKLSSVKVLLGYLS